MLQGTLESVQCTIISVRRPSMQVYVKCADPGWRLSRLMCHQVAAEPYNPVSTFGSTSLGHLHCYWGMILSLLLFTIIIAWRWTRNTALYFVLEPSDCCSLIKKGVRTANVTMVHTEFCWTPQPSEVSGELWLKSRGNYARPVQMSK